MDVKFPYDPPLSAMSDFLRERNKMARLQRYERSGVVCVLFIQFFAQITLRLLFSTSGRQNRKVVHCRLVKISQNVHQNLKHAQNHDMILDFSRPRILQILVSEAVKYYAGLYIHTSYVFVVLFLVDRIPSVE